MNFDRQDPAEEQGDDVAADLPGRMRAFFAADFS